MLLFALCLSSTGLMHGTARAATPTPTATAASNGLAATFNNAGISDDAAPAAANLDAVGSSFSAQALAADGWSPGAVYTLADGATVTVPQIAPGQSDNTVAAGQTFADAGSGGALDLVATSTNGTTAGTGTVTYGDGTTQSFAMSVPDWWGGTVGIAAVAPYRNSTSGAAGAPGEPVPDLRAAGRGQGGGVGDAAERHRRQRLGDARLRRGLRPGGAGGRLWRRRSTTPGSATTAT